MRIRSDRRFHFAEPPSALWAALSDVPSYPHWWSWLHDFDGHQLTPGAQWSCSVHPPLPYRLRFRLTIGEVEPGQLVTAEIDGDIHGRARLDIAGAGHGSDVRLRSALAPSTRWLAAVVTVARPAARRGHDWVLDTGARQFATRASRTRDQEARRRPRPHLIGRAQ